MKVEVLPKDAHNAELIANVHPPDWPAPTPAPRYNLVVIGAGTAGLVTAAGAAGLGARVALVERYLMGGDCLNVGCVPSKAVIRSSRAVGDIRAATAVGVSVTGRVEVDFAAVMERMRGVRTRLSHHDSAERFKGLGVDVFLGDGRFTGPDTVEVNGARLRFKKAVIATGARAYEPDVPGLREAGFRTNENVFELTERPRRLAVIGAGVIGSEYASTFRALGVEVHVVDGREALLPFLDGELARRLQRSMTDLGVRFHWKERVKACTAAARGPVRLALSSGATLAVDAVLVAAGRRACVEGLALEAAGLAVDERGQVPVDAHYRTAARHVFAAGDVVGPPALASVSAEQARVAVCTAFGAGLKREIEPLLSSGIYTIPEVSAVGATEEALRKQGVEHVVGRAEYAHNARGAIIGDRAGFLKLLFRRRDMRLLGVHVLGEQATELVHVGLMTMLCEGGAAELQRACFNVPTLSSLYKDAAYRAQIARDLPEAVVRAAARRKA